MIFARRSALTHRLQLYYMGVTELPTELFRMKNLKRLWLNYNQLCSLPSEIARMTTLERLYVRSSKRSDRLADQKPRSFRSTATSSRLFRPSSVC